MYVLESELSSSGLRGRDFAISPAIQLILYILRDFCVGDLAETDILPREFFHSTEATRSSCAPEMWSTPIKMGQKCKIFPGLEDFV